MSECTCLSASQVAGVQVCTCVGDLVCTCARSIEVATCEAHTRESVKLLESSSVHEHKCETE